MLHLLFFGTIQSTAQEVEWRYEYKPETRTRPHGFWVDDDGNGYFNIAHHYSNKEHRGLLHSFLLLNKDGQYNGSVYVQNCDRAQGLVPFTNDRYVLPNVDCNLHDEIREKKTYLLDYNGNIIREAFSFDGKPFMAVHTVRGWTFFSRFHKPKEYTKFSIANVDEQLNFRSYDVSMAPLKKEGLALSFRGRALEFEKNSWVLSFNYFEPGYTRHRRAVAGTLKHGAICYVRGKQIAWEYPKELHPGILSYTAKYNDKIGLCFSHKSTNRMRFVKLDVDGQELESVLFRPFEKSFTKGFLFTDEHIILIKKTGILYWFDWEGNKVKELDLNEPDFHLSHMKAQSNGHIFIAGSNNQNSVIFKVSPFKDSQETTIDKPIVSQAEHTSDIKYAEANLESELVFSASVFPNPAALRINFEISDEDFESNVYELSVFDLSGKELVRDRFEGQHFELAVQSFPKGSYIYRINKANESKFAVLSGKFIKQ